MRRIVRGLRLTLRWWTQFVDVTARAQALVLPNAFATAVLLLVGHLIYGLLYALGHVAWLAYLIAGAAVPIGVMASVVWSRPRGHRLTSMTWVWPGILGLFLLELVLPFAVVLTVDVDWLIALDGWWSIRIGLADVLAGTFVLLFSANVGLLSFATAEMATRNIRKGATAYR